MKQPACIIVVLTVIAAGCAAPKKIPIIDQVVGLIDPNKPKKVSEDEDFEEIAEELEEQMIKVPDPLEPLNRGMFQVNDRFYFWILKPVANTYKGIAPEPFRISVSNFFTNLATPVRFVNCLLQGKGDSAGTELHRFAVNTTVGILGFHDPARDKYGLELTDDDLGQPLGVYGLGNGFYLVLPILGPSTLRDTAGFIGDQFLNPIRYVKPQEASIGISAGKFTNKASLHIGEYESLKADALDPYVATRDIYIQYRKNKVEE